MSTTEHDHEGEGTGGVALDPADYREREASITIAPVDEQLPARPDGRHEAHEQELLVYGTEVLEGIPGVRMIGTARRKASILSFVIEGIHPHDIGTIVDREGVAIRTGHHCAQPVMDRLGIPATARASLAMYNRREELDALGAAVRKVIEVFG